jgi:hypothetical protein
VAARWESLLAHRSPGGRDNIEVVSARYGVPLVGDRETFVTRVSDAHENLK